MFSNLSSFKWECGISLAKLQRKCSSSRLEGRILWFFLRCGRKLGVPLELCWGPQELSCVSSGNSGPLLCWNFGITLEPLNGLKASSCVESINCVLLSSGDGYIREIFESHKGCQIPLRVSTGNVGFPLRFCSRKFPHLAYMGELCRFSRVEAESFGFLSSCYGNVRNSLALSQGSWVSLLLEGEPQDSSRGAREK